MDYEYYRREENSDDGHKKVEEERKESTLPGMGKSFWQRNGATIITLAILGLIIGGAIAVNERRNNDTSTETVTDVTPTPSEQPTQPDIKVVTPPNIGVIGGGTIAPKPGSPKPPRAVTGSLATDSGIRITETVIGNTKVESFEVTAFRGDGRTHLARRAITEQLRRTDTNLSNEQRVYAEDYLQKHFAPEVRLHPGDKLTFTSDQINEAISASQSLNSAQLENLHQYSVLVSWPPI